MKREQRQPKKLSPQEKKESTREWKRDTTKKKEMLEMHPKVERRLEGTVGCIFAVTVGNVVK